MVKSSLVANIFCKMPPVWKGRSRPLFLLFMIHMPHRLFCLALLIMAMPFVAQAQDSQQFSGWGVETNPFVGKVVKHTVKFHLPIPDISSGLDVNFVSQRHGRKDWEQRRRFPLLGIGLTYTNYGLDSVYGRCLGLYPNITMNLIKGKKLEWVLRIGDGIGYVTHHYSRHPITDTINNAIGSTINDYFSFNTDIRYHINLHWDVQAGASFTHISDASYHQPNLGINLLGGHVGIRYFPVTRVPQYIRKDLPHLKNRWLVQGRVGLAFTQSDAPAGPLFPVYMASAYVSRRWISKNKMFGGLDYSYHQGIYAFLRNNEILPGEEAKNSYKSAIFVGNEFLLGRVGVVLQVGFYLKQAALKQDIYYQKIGANYYLLQREKGPIKELFLTGLLKTHKTIAELAEFGVGLGF